MDKYRLLIVATNSVYGSSGAGAAVATEVIEFDAKVFADEAAEALQESAPSGDARVVVKKLYKDFRA